MALPQTTDWARTPPYRRTAGQSRQLHPRTPQFKAKFVGDLAAGYEKWSGRPSAELRRAAVAVHAYVQRLDIEGIGEPPSKQRQHLHDEASRKLVDLTIAGLERRDGRFLLAPALMPNAPELYEDWLLWQQLQMQLLLFGAARWPTTALIRTRGICVCWGCTVVFRPSGRERSARYCPTCSSKGKPRRLGSDAPHPYMREWPAFLGLVGQNVTEPGETAIVAVPKLVGRVVVGWGERTMIRCEECTRFDFKRAGTRWCDECAGKVSSRETRSRRRRRTGAG